MEEDDPVDKLSAEYIGLRSQREKLKQDFLAKDEVLEERMMTIENSLVDTLTKTGLSSMSTANATIIKQGVYISLYNFCDYLITTRGNNDFHCTP